MKLPMRLSRGARARRRAKAWAAMLACTAATLQASPGRAAFDLRQATPEAIGAVSMDLPFDVLEGEALPERRLTAAATVTPSARSLRQ